MMMDMSSSLDRGSRAEPGSSKRIASESMASTEAKASRRFCPPDNDLVWRSLNSRYSSGADSWPLILWLPGQSRGSRGYGAKGYLISTELFKDRTFRPLDSQRSADPHIPGIHGSISSIKTK
jgi:hypothetical protein